MLFGRHVSAECVSDIACCQVEPQSSQSDQPDDDLAEAARICSYQAHLEDIALPNLHGSCTRASHVQIGSLRGAMAELLEDFLPRDMAALSQTCRECAFFFPLLSSS